ncbi:MAG: NAD(+)/NADH kinase [Planctomycetota bacterium]
MTRNNRYRGIPFRPPARPFIVLTGGSGRADLAKTLRATALKLRERGCRVQVDPEGEADLRGSKADFVVVFGGDGAILGAARRMGQQQIPVIGVRFGRFGFLAELDPSDFEEGLQRLLAGEGRIHERMLLRCRVYRRRRVVVDTLAVNEALVTARQVNRMVLALLEVGGDLVTTYHGDGLIVATPLGSTAHSLAAGGPIVSPAHRSFIVTPLCSHALTNRPLVLPSDVPIDIEVLRSRHLAALTVDGHLVQKLEFGDRVHVEEAQVTCKLLSAIGRSYFETLRTKFHWCGAVELGHEEELDKACEGPRSGARASRRG